MVLFKYYLCAFLFSFSFFRSNLISTNKSPVICLFVCYSFLIRKEEEDMKFFEAGRKKITTNFLKQEKNTKEAKKNKKATVLFLSF